MPEIKSSHLAEILELNNEICNEVNELVDTYLNDFHPRAWNRVEGASKWITDNHFLIQAPIQDDSLGGFILYQERKHVCYINTWQPRVYQNFITLHELYHIINKRKQNQQVGDIHVVESDMDRDQDERKADYFASVLLLDENKLIPFYKSLQSDDLLFKIFFTMKHFNAPYKAVLIRLYELGQIDIEVLLSYFDNAFNLEDEFIKLGLDPAPVQRSYQIDFSQIKKLIAENKFNFPDIATVENAKTFEGVKKYFADLEVAFRRGNR